MAQAGHTKVNYTVSVSATATATVSLQNVNDLERAILEQTRAAGRQLYVRAFATVQESWLAQRRQRSKRQGRGWHPIRAERLLQLKRRLADPPQWNR